MEKHKIYTIIALLAIFVLFFFVQINKHDYYDVLQIISPNEIVVDKNKNGVFDDGEIISVLNGYQFVNKEITSLDKSLNIDTHTHYAIYFLTEKYVNEVLLDKKVFIKNNNIFVNGESYLSIMSKSGYLFKDSNPVNKKAFEKRLQQIKKSDYRLYNLKSNKYHLPECKYGSQAHNYVLVPKSQLPKGALGCKYCIDKKVSKNSKLLVTDNSLKTPNLTFSSGAIKIFLTDYTTNLKPNRLGNTQICNELVKQINMAKYTIDIAIYGYDRVPKIENALKRAIARGVKIRLVHDISAKNENIYANTHEFAKLIQDANCDRAPEFIKDKAKYTNSIMHNKFYIFDNERVITGSANFSHTDMSSYNSNCVILINSKEIANIYTQEFNQMYNNKFHYLKLKLSNKEYIRIGNSVLSIYYSPKDDIINTVLIPMINNAKRYIYIPTFLITEPKIANALINAKLRGLDVKIIVDATNSNSEHSKHRLLRKSGIQVKTENYAGKIHSKSMIIDDKYSIIGSMNFSKSGNYKNDENVVVIENSAIALFYKKFFNYLWSRISDYWLSHDVSAESIYSIGSCSDGIDNDYDGKIDLLDEGCKAKIKKSQH